ncbi:MAG: hypothetical protein AAF388_13365 [Bacteroidota bacterium]
MVEGIKSIQVNPNTAPLFLLRGIRFQVITIVYGTYTLDGIETLGFLFDPAD